MLKRIAMRIICRMIGCDYSHDEWLYACERCGVPHGDEGRSIRGVARRFWGTLQRRVGWVFWYVKPCDECGRRFCKRPLDDNHIPF